MLTKSAEVIRDLISLQFVPEEGGVMCVDPRDVYRGDDNADNGRRRALCGLIRAGLAFASCPRNRTLCDTSDYVPGADPYAKPGRVYVPWETFRAYEEWYQTKGFQVHGSHPALS